MNVGSIEKLFSECLEKLNVMESLKISVMKTFSILIHYQNGVMVCDGMNYCLLWNVQHTNETLWRWKKFPLSLAFHTCKNCLWGKWFDEDIRVFIFDECYEMLVMDIFKLEYIFLKTILLHLYHSDCSFLSQKRKCEWSWSCMVVVERI